jgi:glycosyltransferase involved in cell wall biosynthesis
MVELSLVIPAFNEEKNVSLLYEKLKPILDKLNRSYEIIYVDDGSTDQTFSMLEQLHQKDQNVKVIQFRRNFQKAAALSAGFFRAKGSIIITMDADLQDNPDEIPKFLDQINNGSDLVVGWKYKRKDSWTKTVPSKIFNILVRSLTGIKIHDSDCNFRAMKADVIKDMNIYSGLYRYIPSIASSHGAKIDEIKVVHHSRKFGKSKYGFGRLFKGVFDLLTVKFLLSYAKRPLHFFGGIGTFLFFVGFVLGFYLLYLKYFLNLLIGSRPLLILSLLFIILGAQFISIGLIGEMITSNSYQPEKQYTIKREL